MDAFKIILACILFNVSFLQSKGKRKTPRLRRVANFELFEDCHEGPYPNRINNTRTLNYGQRTTVDFDVNVVQPIRRAVGRVAARKCQTVKDSNCETSVSGYIDMCKVFVDEGQFYSNIFKHGIQPAMKCPLKRGVYKGRNASLSSDEVIALLPVIPAEFQNYHWNIKMNIFEKSKPEKTLMCFSLFFKVDVIKT